jgi:hypothetical protein
MVMKLVQRALPGGVAAGVDRILHHPQDIDTLVEPDMGTVIGNWAATMQPASRNAKQRAEKYLHGYLDQAALEGRRCGRAAVFWFAVPAAFLVLVVAVVLAVL